MSYRRRHYRLTAHPPQRWADSASRVFLGQPPSNLFQDEVCTFALRGQWPLLSARKSVGSTQKLKSVPEVRFTGFFGHFRHVLPVPKPKTEKLTTYETLK